MPYRSQTARTARRLASETGWPPPRVVGDRDDDERDVPAPRSVEEGARAPSTSMFPLNGWSIDGIATLGDDEVDGLGAGVLDVGARRVEVGVVGDDLARAADGREQDLLGGPALVRRDDVLEREERLDRLEEAKP